jgi:hypothetical protein
MLVDSDFTMKDPLSTTEMCFSYVRAQGSWQHLIRPAAAENYLRIRHVISVYAAEVDHVGQSDVHIPGTQRAFP